MAKLRTVFKKKSKYEPTCIEGICYRSPVSFKVIRGFRKLLQELNIDKEFEQSEGSNEVDDAFMDNFESIALWMFDNVFTDDKGELFEDVKTADDLDVLPPVDLLKAVAEVMSQLGGNNNTGKKLSPQKNK